MHGRQFGRLHHLTNAAISQDNGDRAVPVRQVECQDRHIDRFLDARWRQDNGMVIPVPSTANDLIVISLRGGDIAQARTAAHHIDQDHGHLGPGDVGEAFHHQADARAGGGGHRPRAGAGSAIDHVDRG